MIWSHRENTSFHRTVEKVQLLPLGARRLGAALSRSDFSIPIGPQCFRKHCNYQGPSPFKSTFTHQHKKTDQSFSYAYVALSIGNISRPLCLGFCQCVLLFYCPWEIALYSHCTSGSFCSLWNMWVGAVILYSELTGSVEKLPWLFLKEKYSTKSLKQGI